MIEMIEIEAVQLQFFECSNTSMQTAIQRLADIHILTKLLAVFLKQEKTVKVKLNFTNAFI
jgi:hypothetical protein